MKKLLVVVDMQNDFVNGSLGTEEAKAIIANVIEKIKSYPSADVFATRDTHHEDYLESKEGQYLPVAHCIEGTKGWEIVEDVACLIPENHIIDKPTFGSLDLSSVIKEAVGEGEAEIELIGLCTDICVVSNAILLKTNLPDCTVIVDSKCCAGVTPAKHEAALEVMKSCQVEVL